MLVNILPCLRTVGAVLLSYFLLFSLAWAESAVISAPEAFAKAKAGELVLIDVRSPAEWRESGIPAQALPIALNQAGGVEAFQRAVLAAVKGNRDQPIAVICACGGRSRQAQRLLEQAGFTQVQDISEGMLGHDDLPGWIKRGLPVVPCKEC